MQASMCEEVSRAAWQDIGLVRSGHLDRVIKRRYYDNQERQVLVISADNYARYADDVAKYRHWATTYAGWRTVTVEIR